MSIIQQTGKRRQRLAATLCLVCAASVALGAPGASGPLGAGAGGPPGADGRQGPRGCGPEWHRGPPGPLIGFGEDRPPPYLMGVNLSEDQQDKVFAILHAAAPQLRERMKAARKARDALRELSESADYDNGKATSLAQAQASAESQLTLLRTRTDHDIYLVLTPEQRTQIAERRREHAHDGAPPPP
jgi:periplasmic protein CpxP/Spy